MDNHNFCADENRVYLGCGVRVFADPVFPERVILRRIKLRDSAPPCIHHATTRDTRSVLPPRVGNCVWTTTTPTLHHLSFLDFSKETVRAEHLPFRAGENRVWNRTCVSCRAHHLPHGFLSRAHLCIRYLSVLRMSPCLCPVCARHPVDAPHVFDTPMSQHMCP